MRRSRRVVLAAILGALVTGGCGGGSEPRPSRVRWSDQGAPDYYASPALSLDQRTVYFGTSMWENASPRPGNALHALSTADGAVRWSYPLGKGEVRSAPAVASDGSIHFVVETRDPESLGSATTAVHRLSADGTLLWTFDVNPTHVVLPIGLSAPALGEDGSVYAAGDQLYAISPGGQLRWKALMPAFEALSASPVIGRDGTVYFAAHNVPLTAFDPSDGRQRWRAEAMGWPDYVVASPAIGADGTIYVVTCAGIAYAVTPAGEIAWQFDVRSAGFIGDLRSSPAIGADGSLYFGSSQGMSIPALFSLTAEGALRWKFVPADLPPDLPVTHFDIYSSPALGADGAVYFGHEFGRVYALDAATGKVRWVQPTSAGITWSSPAIASDGTLFVGDLGGRYYAVETGAHGLDPAAPWAKYRGDLQNTGRARPAP